MKKIQMCMQCDYTLKAKDGKREIQNAVLFCFVFRFKDYCD